MSAATGTIDAMSAPAPSDLILAADAARPYSHAPYSKFRAGAAVLTADGEVTRGAIVENVSLGLAMCAERVALFGAVAIGSMPVALALVAPLTGTDLTWPCGACLQVALELGGPDMRIDVASADSDQQSGSATVGELLPKGPYVRR